MIKYRILFIGHSDLVSEGIIAEGLTEEQANEVLNTYCTLHPDLSEKFNIEKYSFDPAGPHWGRDPDLH